MNSAWDEMKWGRRASRGVQFTYAYYSITSVLPPCLCSSGSSSSSSSSGLGVVYGDACKENNTFFLC